jgi:hydroxymethylglutaryl-CoA lyase
MTKIEIRIAAVEAGATLVDTALGGLGGCPFAPGAAGNVATEDVCWALGAMGFEADPKPAELVTVARWLREELGVDLASRMPPAARFEWEPYAA